MESNRQLAGAGVAGKHGACVRLPCSRQVQHMFAVAHCSRALTLTHRPQKYSCTVASSNPELPLAPVHTSHRLPNEHNKQRNNVTKGDGLQVALTHGPPTPGLTVPWEVMVAVHWPDQARGCGTRKVHAAQQYMCGQAVQCGLQLHVPCMFVCHVCQFEHNSTAFVCWPCIDPMVACDHACL